MNTLWIDGTQRRSADVPWLEARAQSPLVREPTPSSLLPWDLREWVPAGDLINWVEDDAQTLTSGQRESEPGFSGTAPVPASTMLCLLAYGYVTQVFSSQEIVSRCCSDVGFRLLCGTQRPFAHELTRFRRQNHALITSLLESILQRALRHKSRAGGAGGDFNPGLYWQLRSCAAQRLDLARHLDVCDE
jgi:hypothetical protein